MSIRTVVLLLLLLALGVFVAVNWTAFTAPTTLSLLVATVQAPLGIVMLGITGVLVAAFLAYAFYLQTSVLLETRRMARELSTQRELADQAEASRFTELRSMLESRFDTLASASRSQAAQSTEALRLAIQQAVNGLEAQLGEMDQRYGGRVTPSLPDRRDV